LLLVAGEGPEDDLGTCCRAAAVVNQSSSRESESETDRARMQGEMEEKEIA
jgi:hypothetical protein